MVAVSKKKMQIKMRCIKMQEHNWSVEASWDIEEKVVTEGSLQLGGACHVFAIRHRECGSHRMGVYQ